MAGILSLLRRLYLTVYNWAVFLGWSQVLFLAVKTLKDSGHEHVYNAVEKPLQLAQTAAVLEILHGLVGLVRSPITATLPQIGSRLYLTWVILYSVPEIRSHFLVTSLVISWSITEVSMLQHLISQINVEQRFRFPDPAIALVSLCCSLLDVQDRSVRYSFFGMKEVLGFAPSWLMWLRYSTFLLLYPTGISSEVGLVYFALPYIKESDKYCIRMPNKWNFSFDNFYAAILALGIYIPGSPHMFSYMLAQRKKALSKSKRD